MNNPGSLRLNADFAEKVSALEIKHNLHREPPFSVSLAQYVGAIVIGLDEDVFVDQNDGNGLRKVHSRDFAIQKNEYANWLHLIHVSSQRPAASSPGSDVESYINKHASRLRVIEENGEVLGLAALQTWAVSGPSQLQTVGGLATRIHARGTHHFFGFMECNPKSAKRDAGKLRVSIETLKAWAEEQRDLLKTQQLNTFHMEGTAASLAKYDVDPIDFAAVQFELLGTRQWATLRALIAMLERGQPVGMLRSQKSGRSASVREHPPTEVAILQPMSFFSKYSKGELEKGRPKEDYSLLGCLHRGAETAGLTVTWTVHDGFAMDTTHEYVDLVVCSIHGKHTLQVPPLETNKSASAPKPKRLTKNEKKKRKRDRKKKNKSKKRNR